MCIRDRGGDGLADAADFSLANGAVHNLVIGAIFGTGGGNLFFTDRSTAVSYTHLDVYKRQALHPKAQR